jgi:hypothetical protein
MKSKRISRERGKMGFIKVLLSGLLISIVCCGSQAMAIDLYGFASYWDKKDLDGNWGGGVGLSLPLFTEHLRLDGRAYYFGDSDVGRDLGKLQLIPFDLGLQVHILPSGTVDPYILGGITYIYVDDSDWFDTNSEFGGYIGAGLDVELGTSLVKLFGEAIYRFAEVDTFLDNNFDVGGFTGNIGIKLHF